MSETAVDNIGDLVAADLSDPRRCFPCGVTPLGRCDFVRPDPECIRGGKIFMRSTNLSHCGSWLTIKKYLKLRKRPYRSVGIWSHVPEDNPAVNHIAAAHSSPDYCGTRAYDLEKKVETIPALVAALRKARPFIEHEADTRASGSPASAYEREPVELLAVIDAALKKATP